MSTKKRLRKFQISKFEDKRTGPFIVQSKLNNRAYKLQNLEGKTLLKYYNSDRLAKYYKKQNWQPVIVINKQDFQRKFLKPYETHIDNL